MKKGSIKGKLFAHFEAWRVYSLIWAGIVSLVGACVSTGDFPTATMAFLAFFIPVTGWIAGLYIMDFLDRKLDVIEKPTRPIPSGRIQPKEAVFCAFLFAGMGLFLSFMLPYINIIIVFFVGFSVIVYTLISKARGLLQNLNRGIITWVTFFFGYLAVAHTVPLQVLLFSLLFFFHDASTNIIGGLRDIKGDEQGGFRTTPVRYGVTKSLLISLLFTIIFILIVLYSVLKTDIFFFIGRFSMAFLLVVIILVALYGIGFHLRDELDRKKSLLLHSLFVVERVILACAFILGIASNLLISLSVFLICVPAAIILQVLFRKRYEMAE